MKKVKVSLYEQLGIVSQLPGFMLSKTTMCKHNKYSSCSENVLRSFSRTFLNMLSIKLVANNIFYFAKPKKLLQNLMKWSSFKDNITFALFLAMMNATYKMVLCFLRRYLKDDKLSAPIAGILAGLWIGLENKNRRAFMAVLLMSRMFDAQTRLHLDKKRLPEIPYFNIAIWTLCIFMQQYSFSYESDCVNPGVYKFLSKWGARFENDKAMQITFNKVAQLAIKEGRFTPI